MKSNRYLIIIILGIISELLYLIFVFGQSGERSIPLYIGIYALAFVVFYAAYLQTKNHIKSQNHNHSTNSIINYRDKTLITILLFGILFRITLIPTGTSTSDDVYRYMWEGKVLYNGHNPFELSPDDEKLQYLHSEKLPANVSFKDMTTIYPTVAHSVFMLGYILTGENETGLKLIYLLAEILTFLFLVRIFHLRKLNPYLVILYAWLPLPIMEFFINSHIDVIGIMFFVIFLYYILQDKFAAASVPFALSVLVKPYPIFLIPLLFKKLGIKNTLYFSLIVFVIVMLLLIPLIPENRPMNESLFTYLKNWSFNGSIYSLINSILRDGYKSKEIMLILFIAAVGNIALRYNDFLKAIYGVWICFIAFSATLYPWYLGWIAVVNPFFGFASVISLLFTSNVSNITPMGDVWVEHWWVLILQYLPFYILLIYEIIKLLPRREGQK